MPSLFRPGILARGEGHDTAHRRHGRCGRRARRRIDRARGAATNQKLFDIAACKALASQPVLAEPRRRSIA